MDFIRAFFAAAVLVFLSVSTTLFPQSPGAGLNTPGGPEVSPQATAELSAMANYRAGRDLEARSRMNEADVYYNEAVRIR